MDEALGDDIVLLGYDAPQRTVEAGASLPLSLYWQAQRDVASDYSVRLTLVEPMAELWRRSTNGRLMEPTRPLAGSRRDRVRPARFRFAGDHAGSEYELRLGLVPAGADRPVAELSLGDVAVAGRTHQFEVPPIETPLAVTSPVRRSAGLRPALERDTMSITLYWQARGAMDVSYKVFVHILGPDGKMWGQKDDVPGQGILPTTGWLAGEVLADTYDVPLDQNAPLQDARIEIGFYDPVSGVRLPVVDENGNVIADHVILPN